MKNATSHLKVAFSISLLIISGFYILSTAAGGGVFVTSEPDTPLYYQYARNISEGNLYVYSPGDAPSTGSTTHLFPFALSLLFIAGIPTALIPLAGFILNAFFYLVVIYLVWLIAQKMCPEKSWLIMLMTALSGQLASAILRQTDMGFFTMLALGIFVALLYERYRLLLFLIPLCAVSRPEGLIFSIAFGICGISGSLVNRKTNYKLGYKKQYRFYLLFFLMGCAAFLFTLFINYKLTGYFQFMSVANKGYFKTFPLSGAIVHTLAEGFDLIRGFFIGLSKDGRQFYLLPFAGAVLGFSGFLVYPRSSRRKLQELWLLLTLGACIALIASSQYQGVSNDRYLAWITPIWITYIAIGVREFNTRVKSELFLPLISALLIGFQFISILYISQDVYTVAIEEKAHRDFAERIKATITPDRTLGTGDAATYNYYMPEYKIFNLSGITSPDFFHPKEHQQLPWFVDLVKYRPELRFDYWLISEVPGQNLMYWLEPFVDRLVLENTEAAYAGKDAHCVYVASWDHILNGDSPVLIDSQTIDSLELIDKLDVGYLVHETDHDYHIQMRIRNIRLPLFAQYDLLGVKKYSDAGRIIPGIESFSVYNINPNKDLTIILRTGKKASGSVMVGQIKSRLKNIIFNEDLKLLISVDGYDVPTDSIPLRDEGFSEVMIRIPQEYLTRDTAHISIGGDHISYAYWFYQ